MKRLFALLMIVLWIAGNTQVSQQITVHANESASNKLRASEKNATSSSTDSSSSVGGLADNSTASSSSSLPSEKTQPVEPRPTVHTYDEFKTAYENVDVQEIILAEDISGDARNLAKRTATLVINGQQHQLKLLDDGALPLGQASGSARLTLRDMSIDNGLTGPFILAQNDGIGWLLTFERVGTTGVSQLSNIPDEQVSLIETTNPAKIAEDDSDAIVGSSSSGSESSSSSSSVSIENSQGSSTTSESDNDASKDSESNASVSRETSSAKTVQHASKQKDTDQSNVEGTSKLGETEREVSNISELQAAINEQAVTKIFLKNNISATSISANTITRSLEIDGQQHSLNIGTGALRYGVPAEGNPTLNLHDIQVTNTAAAFVTYVGAAARGQWHFEFSNISTATTVNRLVIGTYSDITFSGTCNIDTRAENVYAGSVKMADNTVYTGNVNNTNYSMFYYDLRATGSDTGATREFTTGRNCTLNLTGTNGAQSYPIVYLYYHDITLGAGTKFNAEWPGNNVTFQAANDNASLTIGENAQMNLDTDERAVAAIRAAAGTNTLTVASRGSLTARNTGTNATVDLGVGTTTATIDEPTAFDLQNTGTGTNNRALTTNANSSLTLSNSPFAYWDTAPVSGDPTESFERIEWGQFAGNTVTSNPATMANAVKDKTLHRMAAYNPPGTLQLSSVPDNLNFGRDLIVRQPNQLFPLVSLDQPLSVTDQRYVTKQWSLSLKLSQALKNTNGDLLPDAIKYKKGGELLPVSDATIEIETQRNADNDPYVVSNQWNDEQGLMLQVSPEEAKAGAYSGEITWNLSDVPAETEG